MEQDQDGLMRGLKATYAEAKATHDDVRKLLPLLALLEEPEGESPIMMILSALAELAVAVQALEGQTAAANTKLDFLIAYFGAQSSG